MAVSQEEARSYYNQLIKYGSTPDEASREVAQYIAMMDTGEPTEISIQDSISGPVAGAVTDRAIQSILGGGGTQAATTISSNGPVILGAGGEAVASAAPWATAAGEGVLLNPATGEAVATAAPWAADASATALGPWSWEGIGASGNAILPAAGLAIGAESLLNKRHGGRGAAQGAVSGAMIGSYFGPWGIPIGAALGGGIGYFGNFGDENKFQTEYNRAQALRDKGIDWDLNTQKPSRGRSKEELTAEAARNIAMGQYGNTEFAGSRNESDLTPEDIWGYSQWGEKFGNDWLKTFSEDQRRQISQLALDRGLVREHHGTVDINFDEGFDADVEKIKSGEMKVETTPWTPETPGASIDPGRIPSFNINFSGGGNSQSNANSDMTTQALISMGLSNDDSVNLISQYKQLGALSPNEAAQAAYSIGQMKGSS